MPRLPRWTLGLLLTAGATASAHHALDLSDAAPIQLEGEIEFMSWDGAHVLYDIRGMDDRGEPRTWAILGASPKILRSRGIAKSTFKVGERVRVIGRLDLHTRMVAPDYFVSGERQYEMGFYPRSMAPRSPTR